MTSHVSRATAEGGTLVSHAPSRLPRVIRMLRDLVLLLVPAVAVTLTLFIAWQLRLSPLTLFDGILSPPGRPELYPSNWLTVGHAVVPVVFLIANLVNRRYGEDYALAHVLVSWTLAVLMALAVILQLNPHLPPAGELPPLRVTIAFAAAMTIGQLASVYVFELTRGVVWWKAPLYSALTNTFIAMFLFYPAAFAGTDPFWPNRMAIDAGTKAFMSFALLLPYLALRPIVRPQAGLGGY